MRGSWLKLAAASVIIVTLALAPWVIGAKSPPATRSHASLAVPVTAATARAKDVSLTIETYGRVEASATVQIKPRVDEAIAEVLFQGGSRVRKGQPLFRLDRRLLDARAREAEATYKRDAAILAKLKTENERNESLFAQGFISMSALVSSRADWDAAKARAEASRAAADAAALQLENATIESPIDGMAGAVLLTEGALAKANESTLVVVNQIDPATVSFSVPESGLAALHRSWKVGGQEVLASLPNDPQEMKGRLFFEDNSIDTTSGTITLKARFPNSTAALKPGQFVKVSIAVGRMSEALVVPASATLDGPEGPYVFLIRVDSTVDVRPVQLGPLSDGMRVIVKGLQLGDRVVAEGSTRLQKGSSVTVRSLAEAGATGGRP